MPSVVSRRDQHIMFGLAVLSVAFVVLQSLTGLNPDALLAAPALLLFLPLLADATSVRTGCCGSPHGGAHRGCERRRACGRCNVLLARWPAVGG